MSLFEDYYSSLVERKARMIVAYKMPDRTSSSMKMSILSLSKELNENAIQTATCDRGKEFSCYKEIESETKIKMYFADPYSSWQRGTNENSTDY